MHASDPRAPLEFNCLGLGLYCQGQGLGDRFRLMDGVWGSGKPFIYEARESSLVREGCLTAQLLKKL